jgi:hypothetical protein
MFSQAFGDFFCSWQPWIAICLKVLVCPLEIHLEGVFYLLRIRKNTSIQGVDSSDSVTNVKQ